MLNDDKELVRDVQFKTIFRVYMCLLKLGEASTRDVQRAMGFPTPAQATYHLKRLIELGLVKAEGENSFKVVGKKFGLLRFLFMVRGRILPMSLFYTIFFAGLTAFLFFRSPSLELFFLGALVVVKEAVDTYLYWDAAGF